MSTTLPDKTNGSTGIIDTAVTPGQQKTNLGNLRDFIADLFGTTTAALATVWAAFRLQAPTTLHNGSLTFSVGSSALTIALKTRAGATPSATDPVLIGQRSATAGNGDFNLRAITAAPKSESKPAVASHTSQVLVCVGCRRVLSVCSQ